MQLSRPYRDGGLSPACGMSTDDTSPELQAVSGRQDITSTADYAALRALSAKLA
ncbi:MAG: hypothetical protein ACR2LK_06300 [Solirubrobacteraceae bacterium]